MADYKYKLSIIVPMYNAGKYVANCLDSILASDLPKGKYEVVIVNDGSKDDGPAIAREYVKKNEDFKYLEQDNQGLSVARNTGISASEGEYIWCVDSDDMIEKNVCYVLEKIEELGNPDIFSTKLKYVTESLKFIACVWDFPNNMNRLMKGRDAVINGFNPSSVCVLFIKRELMEKNNLAFYPGITHQDSELSYKLFAHAETVFFSDFVPYIYIRHPNTTLTSKDPQKIIKRHTDDIIIVKSFAELAKTFKESDPKLAEAIHQRSKNLNFGMVYSLYKRKREYKPFGISNVILEAMKREGQYPLKGSYGSWKKNLFSKLLNLKFFVQ